MVPWSQNPLHLPQRPGLLHLATSFSSQRGQQRLPFAPVLGLLNHTIHFVPLGASGKPQPRARAVAQVRDPLATPGPLASGAGCPMGSVAPEAGPGRKPPAAPRDRAPASSLSSSTSSAAKGAGASPPVPVALFVPAARGRTRAHLTPPPHPTLPPSVERRRGGDARAGARRSSSLPVRQASGEHARPPRPPLPPPSRSLALSLRNLLTARPGGAEPSRA